MTILRQINLSNIRRFGKDVDIPLSPQATIILAPNGTGKTALFEAIELGLTGTVARLVPNRESLNKENMLALIRDQESEAKVSLLFDSSEYSAVVGANGEIKWTAPDWFYGDSNKKDTGYLLRLTHLLDQRDRYWFVQETSEEAGSLLSKLPIGKEALYVSSILSGLKKSITRSMESKNFSLEIISKKLAEWGELLSERKAIKENMGESFLTLDQIAQDLISNRSFEFALDSIDKVAMAHSVCISDNNLELENSKKQLSELQQLKSIFNEYHSTLKTKQKLELLEQNELENIKSIKKSIEEALINVNQNIDRYSRENIDLLSKIEILNKLKEHDQVLHSLNEQTAFLKLEKLKLIETRKTYEVEKIKVEKARDLRNRYEIWNSKNIDIQKKIQEYEQAQKNLLAWHKYLSEKNSSNERIIELRNINLKDENALKLVGDELSSSKLRAKEASSQLDAFKQANDKVKASIAEIAANISEKQSDCPLCGVNHGLEELKKRIAEKLDAIDPALIALTEYEHECQKKVRDNKQAYESALLKFNLSSVNLDKEFLQFSDIEKNIIEISKLSIFNTLEIKEATDKLKNLKVLLDMDKDSLERELISLQPIISEQNFLEYKQLFNLAEENFLEREKNVFKAEESKFILKQKFDSLVRELESNSTSMNSNSVEEEVKDKKIIVDEILRNKLLLENRIELDKTNLNTTQFKLDNHKLELKNVKSKAEKYRQSWSDLGLIGEPNELDIEKSIFDQIEIKSKIEKKLLKLEEIRIQIAYLRAADKLRLTQDKINNLRKNLSEIDYQNQLENECVRGKEEIDFHLEKRAMIETFTKYLKDEIEEIQTRVVGIQPLWQSLLKRIVRESRFSHTGLELNRRYNKSHAQVQVQVSGRDTLASLVASEAQKTDLQLTFLLSMALVHQWSPWRGLLLDDPTQHHDLVHASAVFDVLRDYMSEYGFQVVITTHDPVQARYFVRKLKNDGIDTKLVTLIPTVGGVEAQVVN